MCGICGDWTHDNQEDVHHTLSRRRLLQTGAAVVGAGAVFGETASALFAQAPAAPAAGVAQGPPPTAGSGVPGGLNANARALSAQRETERQATSRTAGARFQALVRHGNAITTETVTLKPIHPLQVVIRNQAVQTCYTGTFQLDTTTRQDQALVTGHGGVGIVADVGSAVKRVRVGDQVILSATPNCGVCGECLAGRGDVCTTRLPSIQTATMSDNTPVWMTLGPMGPAGHSELLVADEDWVVPIFTKVPPVEVAMLGCPGGVGLGLTMTRFPVEAGSDVVIFGLGPMGMSIVQGAKIQGAKTIIGVEPIRYRRELALKLGATHVLDPNEFTGNNGNDLVARIRALTPDVVPAGRRFLGERPAGPLFGFESTAQTQYALAPGIEAPPQGVDVFNQLYTSVRNGGYVQMAGAVRTSAGMLVGNKVVLSGNFPGIVVLRDLPRFVNLIEKGLFDAKGLIGRVYRPNQMLEAAQAAGNRSVISSVIDFT